MTLKVEIGLLHDLPTADSVTAEPVSEDDWEVIVRTHALCTFKFTQLIVNDRNLMLHT